MSDSVIYLSDSRLLFIGKPLKSGYQAMPVARLILCLSANLFYRLSAEQAWRPCSSLLLPAGANLQFRCSENAVLADMYLDVCGNDYSVLRQQAHRREQGIYSEIRDEKLLSSTLLEVLKTPRSAGQIWQQLQQLINPADLTQSAYYQADPRIERVLNRIRKAVRENLSAQALASEVGLSASRLLSLFKQQTGLPIRRYRLWWRLHHALQLMAQNRSLTEAAISSGFSDSSHFSRSFTEFFGFAPSLLTRKSENLKLFVTFQQ